MMLAGVSACSRLYRRLEHLVIICAEKLACTSLKIGFEVGRIVQSK